jgi:hypothetical protein
MIECIMRYAPRQISKSIYLEYPDYSDCQMPLLSIKQEYG